MEHRIIIGSRVYLRNCIAGEPGVCVGFERGKAVIHWPDLWEEMGRDTAHRTETLIVDESFVVRQLGFQFEEEAAA